ncbi:hypothetical protein VNO77_16083 [Canavalia gladiata]|uniref:Thaumatin-like protein 1 n=1 Tax=Canavalia gladiata TaxID=3824 RepID=A0AAN9M0I4_CANGL
MRTHVALWISFSFLLYAAQGATVTFTNQCSYPLWPATLTGGENAQQLANTGFELQPGESDSVELPSPWSGRFWARTGCSNNGGGFTCATGDCASGQVECNGAGGIPPVTLVEITVAENGGQDFYDVSNVDGFNVPVSISPEGGTGECATSTCPVNINDQCPEQLQQRDSNGNVIACKSACEAFGDDQYCCTGNNSTPETCPPTDFSLFFEEQCPDAYSYAYDDQNSTFTCSSSPNYFIIFCPDP